ncbi:MAG: glycosyltransferase family 39 protein [Acidobacteriota bacterium]
MVKQKSACGLTGRFLPYALGGNLVFIVFTSALFLSGVFQDWQELVTEPWLINQGLRNYSDIATHHAPLLTESLALIYRFLGSGIVTRMVILFLVSAATAVLLFRAVCRLAGEKAALCSMLLFTILWPFYGGMNFWFDTFLPLFYLAAFVLLTEKRSSGFVLLSGIVLGLSFLIKQQGGVTALGVMAMILMRPGGIRSRMRESLLFSGGVLLPVAVISVWYAGTGQLRDAFYWIIKYNLSDHYVSLGTVYPPAGEIVRLLVITAPVLFFAAAALFFRDRRRLVSWNFLLAAGMGLLAFFTVYPRWERWHVIPLVPFLVICLAVSVKGLLSLPDEGNPNPRNRKILRVGLGVWLFLVIVDVGTFYPPIMISQVSPGFTDYWPLHSYGLPAWADKEFMGYRHDIPKIGKYIRQETGDGDRILVWGWGLERLYYDSGRLPAGRFYYALPWFTCLPRLGRDLEEGIENHKPRYVVTALKQFPGTPDLSGVGVDLDKYNYFEIEALKDRFPGVVIWRSGE